MASSTLLSHWISLIASNTSQQRVGFSKFSGQRHIKARLRAMPTTATNCIESSFLGRNCMCSCSNLMKAVLGLRASGLAAVHPGFSSSSLLGAFQRFPKWWTRLKSYTHNKGPHEHTNPLLQWRNNPVPSRPCFKETNQKMLGAAINPGPLDTRFTQDSFNICMFLFRGQRTATVPVCMAKEDQQIINRGFHGSEEA